MEELDTAQEESNICADTRSPEALHKALQHIEEAIDDWYMPLQDSYPACLKDLLEALADARRELKLDE